MAEVQAHIKKNKQAHLSLCLTTLLAAQPNNRGSFPGSAKYFSLKRPKPRWGPRRILCNESRVIFSGVKAASDCQADHSLLSNAELTDGAVLTLPNSPVWHTREQLQVYLVITDKDVCRGLANVLLVLPFVGSGCLTTSEYYYYKSESKESNRMLGSEQERT
jgi:hypothetical protein